MKIKQLRFALAFALVVQFQSHAQTNTPADTAHQNVAVIPVPRTGKAATRQALVLQRAKDGPGDYDFEFIGDSITEGWETRGSNVWHEFSDKHKVINFGVGGDRTEHVLWRFQQGQLNGIKAKTAVVMIGTNNSNNRKDGTEEYTESDILEGVTDIVKEIRKRQPETKIFLMAIFPRAKTFSAQRGKILQVNEALARLDDGKNIFYLDIGPQLIEDDGSISQTMMKDYLHPGEAGYKIWAKALEQKLKQIRSDSHS